MSRLDYVNSLYIYIYILDYPNVVLTQCITILGHLSYNHILISFLQHKLQIPSLKNREFLKSVSLDDNLFNIYLNTYNILSERISYYRPLSSLRPSKSVKINVPKYNYETIMSRSFSESEPTNCSPWNTLSAKLRCEEKYNIFRRKVKYFININIFYIYLS